MRTAVFQEPYKIETVSKNIPSITTSTDAVVKVAYSGLCGSDLHYYRGHIPLTKGTTMGHEFIGTIVEKGSQIDDEDLAIGDHVVSVFTIQCGSCYYCKLGNSGTCEFTNTFGKPGLEGGQAEYVLVPFAKSTLSKIKSLNDAKYVLMADIFVTGYFGVKKILDHYSGRMEAKTMSILQIGAGPVGLCAVRILKHFGFSNIVVVDGIESRLLHAKRLGASETINYTSEQAKLSHYISNELQGRGFDAVLEIVGASSAMKMAFDSIRKGGFIASVGMGHESLPFDALQAYVKGVTVSFGRCNAWSLFKEALEVFELTKDDFENFIEAKVLIEDAAEYYTKFEKGEIGKVVFEFHNG